MFEGEGLTEYNDKWSVRELRRRLKEGERIYTGNALLKDNSPIMFCNKMDDAFGVDTDCPRIQYGTIFLHKNRVFNGCIGSALCDWKGEGS